jgi:hypothetical protein
VEINAIPVHDAKKPVVLTINQVDCDKGKTKDPGSCAAARASIRQFHAFDARVHISITYVGVKDKRTGKKHYIRYTTPGALSREIVAFDRGAAFMPGHYVLQVPTSTQRLGAQRTSGPSGPKKCVKIAQRRHYTENVRARRAGQTAKGSKGRSSRTSARFSKRGNRIGM